MDAKFYLLLFAHKYDLRPLYIALASDMAAGL